MPYMIGSRSVADGVSLSVSKSKLVYRSLISVDNKVKRICLLTQQQLVQFLSVIHKLFYLSGEFCIFEEKSARRMKSMKQSTILLATLRNLHQLKKIFYQQNE